MFAEKDGKSFPEYRAEYIETFNLSDIDPASITVTKDLPISITLSTTNDRALIHCAALDKNLGGENYGKNAGCIPEIDSNETLRLASVGYAQRLAKAFRHAVVLCGGKRSTF